MKNLNFEKPLHLTKATRIYFTNLHFSNFRLLRVNNKYIEEKIESFKMFNSSEINILGAKVFKIEDFYDVNNLER